MDIRIQKWGARLLLLLGLGLGLLWLARLDRASHISTDVLDLIPLHERSPELMLARKMAGERQARVALFVLRSPSGELRAQATQRFTEVLRADPAFAEVQLLTDPGPREALGRQLFAQRLDLLLPGWLAQKKYEYNAAGSQGAWPDWLAERTASKLESFLSKPEAVAFQDLVPADPLLLLPGLATQMLSFADTNEPSGDSSLVWARTSAPPLSEAGQKPVLAAVAKALEAAKQTDHSATLQWMAIGRFAAESRSHIESEMSSLNLFSLVAVLAVAVLCLRRFHQSLHLVPVVLGALVGAWTGVTLAFDRVHVLVFVVGSLLGGVAIDYGFYLYLQPATHPGETYHGKVCRLLRPLAASAITTVLGFSLLLLSDLPLIRQLGVFVSCGLITALATAILWFAQIEMPYAETRSFAKARLASGRPMQRSVAHCLLLAGAAVAIVGTLRLQWRDDIRDLEATSEELRTEATQVRALFGETAQRTIYLTRGESPSEVREAQARFLAWHAEKFQGATVASLGLALPTPNDWKQAAIARQELAGFPEVLRDALERHGFSGGEFSSFYEDWERWRTAPASDLDTAVRTLAGSLKGPMALMAATDTDGSWLVTVAEHPPGAEPPAEFATVGMNQLQSFNRLFFRYRVSALKLSALGLGLVGLSVFALYGLRRGVAIFALPSGACLFAFGVLGLWGHPLNLFHLLGAFLGVCLSHNYAIFTAENLTRGDVPPPSIRLSALSTAASFGVLAFSSIPVVAALGSVVTLIVVAALAGVELVPLLQLEPKKSIGT
jgi:predicted exporter